MFAAAGLHRPIALHVPPVGQVLLPAGSQVVVQICRLSAWNSLHIGALTFGQSCSVAQLS